MTRIDSGRIAALIFFILALFLRTCGLSHDLHLNMVYHPDTPKQMRAVERFLQDDYYTIMGSRDYDGYPYFNSHLIEYILRAYEAVGGRVAHHLGIADQIERPVYLSLFWITRLFNALLSSLAVVIITWLGIKFVSPLAGWTAGFLFALSPVDITACHYAASDTTAAFLALAAMAIAMLISKSQHFFYYAAAGLLSAAAFSTKYHGGMALLATLVAHALTYRRLQLFGWASIARLGLLTLAFTGGVFLTSPALIIAPKAAFDDILTFLSYTASFGMTPEMSAMSLSERIRMGMSLNLPALTEATGLIPLLLALAGVWAGRKNAITWIIATVPLFYIFAGLSTKPLAHPVYHTMATPGIFLLAGAGLFAVASSRRFVWSRRLIVLGLCVISALYLAHVTRTELFFFRHNDTRYLSRIWSLDNIPASFPVHTTKYTFQPDSWSNANENPPGVALVYSERIPVRPPADAIPLHSWSLERDKLTVFRNFPQHIFIQAPELLERPPIRPGFMPMPAFHPQNMIMADAPWLIRHPATWLMGDGRIRSGTLASAQPLNRIFWFIRAGNNPCEITLSCGGNEQRVRLAAGESYILEVDRPRPAPIRNAIMSFYPWRIRMHFGHARISLLHDDRDIAWAYFNTGQFEAARHLFEQASANTEPPGDSIARQLCHLITHGETGEDTPPVEPVALLKDYGISPGYLRELSGVIYTPGSWSTNYITPVNEPAVTSTLITIRGTPIEPGMYHFALRLARPHDSIMMDVFDSRSRTIERIPLAATDNKPLEYSALFTVDHVDAFAGFRLLFTETTDIEVASVSIIPDHEATLNTYANLLTTLNGQSVNPASVSRLWYTPLLAFGDALTQAGQIDRAREIYAMAIESAPMRREARLRADPSPAKELFEQRNPVNARFKNNAVMTYHQINRREVKAGESLLLAIGCEVPKLTKSILRTAIYVQGLPPGQKQARFYGDGHLMDGLRLNRANDFNEPVAISITIPPETTPGPYELVAGLWVPSQKRRIRAASADLPFDRRGVVLTTIQVLP